MDENTTINTNCRYYNRGLCGGSCSGCMLYRDKEPGDDELDDELLAEDYYSEMRAIEEYTTYLREMDEEYQALVEEQQA